MFSINKDFNLSDDDINFSLLQAPVGNTEKKTLAPDNNYGTPVSEKTQTFQNSTLRNTYSPTKCASSASSDCHETPKPKRFKFVKKPTMTISTKERPEVTGTETVKETINNIEDFFGNDSEEDELLSQIEIPEKVCTKPANRNTPLMHKTPQQQNRQVSKIRNNTDKGIAKPCSSSTSSKKSAHLETVNKTPLHKMTSKPVVTPRSQRKFPGPAGILPQLSTYTDLKTLKSPEISKERRPLTPQTPNTPLQNIVNLTEENDVCFDVWVEMNALLHRKFPNQRVESIKDILEKASHRKLDKCKVPLMCGVIKSSSVIGNSGRLILNDNTGDIHGAVHSNILEEYQNGLQRGSGLILKDTSVFSPTVKKHYLNITPSNIVAFFEREIPEEPLTQATQQNTSKNRTILLDSDD